MATSFSEYKNSYIDNIYEQKKKAAAEALAAAYQQNMAEYDAQAEETSAAYGTQRNRTQAEYEQAMKNFSEHSTAAGLNSGAQAQARIAYGAQNQSGLSSLSEGEATAISALARARAAAEADHQTALAENESAYDTDRYNALYAAWQDEVAKDEADRSYYYTVAMNAIQTGNVPDSATLAKAGIDAATATTMAAYYKGMSGTSSSGGAGSSGSGSGSSSGSGSGQLSGLGTSDSSDKTGSTASGTSGSSGTTGLLGVTNNPYSSGGSMAYSIVAGYIGANNLTAANNALAKYASQLTTSQYNELLSRIRAKTSTSSTTAASASSASKTTSAAKSTGASSGGGKYTSKLMTR